MVKCRSFSSDAGNTLQGAALSCGYLICSVLFKAETAVSLAVPVKETSETIGLRQPLHRPRDLFSTETSRDCPSKCRDGFWRTLILNIETGQQLDRSDALS